MGFSRQEYWSGLPFPSPGTFLTQGSNPGLLRYRQILYHLSYQGSPQIYYSSVQSLSCVWLFVTPWTVARQASCPSPTHGVYSNSYPLCQWCHPTISFCHLLLLLLSHLPSIRVFSNESVPRIRWPKYWSFTFTISPSNEYLGLISFRMDWLALLAVQGTLMSLLQHHSSKASIFQCSTFFIVQLSLHIWLLEKPRLLLDRHLLAK